MDNQFREFFDTFLDIWKRSSLEDLTYIISTDYKAREISGGEVVDFGYEEAINGWKQGFNFVKENDAEWELNEISILPLRDDETMAIMSATLVIEGKSLETVNLFFETFKRDEDNNWKLVRSYIEAGVIKENIDG
ncbi:flavoprotein [Virgibacillus sp. JSM 102003]|uniref:flavoprotein n=1 Tax=Virgibacillus sp. JSM 102003 TaxID=1562108 RepID=UPI0035BFB95E